LQTISTAFKHTDYLNSNKIIKPCSRLRTVCG